MTPPVKKVDLLEHAVVYVPMRLRLALQSDPEKVILLHRRNEYPTGSRYSPACVHLQGAVIAARLEPVRVKISATATYGFEDKNKI